MGGIPPQVEKQEKKENDEKKQKAKERAEQMEADENGGEDKGMEAASMLQKAANILKDIFGKKKQSELILKGLNVTSELREIAKEIVASAEKVNRDDVLRAFVAVHGPTLGKDMQSKGKEIGKAVDLVLADLKKDPEIGSKIEAESQPAKKETDSRGHQGAPAQEDPSDSPDPDDAHYQESTQVAPVETDSRGYQGDESAVDPGEKPHSGDAASPAKKNAGKKPLAFSVDAQGAEAAQQAIEFIVAQMERGIPFQDAKAEAEKKFNTSVPGDQQQFAKRIRKQNRATMMAAVNSGRRSDKKQGGYGNPNGEEENGNGNGNPNGNGGEENGNLNGNGGEENGNGEEKPKNEGEVGQLPAKENGEKKEEAKKKTGLFAKLTGADLKAAEAALATAQAGEKKQRDRAQSLAKTAENHQKDSLYWHRKAVEANRKLAIRSRMDLVNSILRQEIHKNFIKSSDSQKRILELKTKKVSELKTISETLNRAPVSRRPEYGAKNRNRNQRVASNLSAPETNFSPTMAAGDGSEGADDISALDDPDFFGGRIPEFHPPQG